MNANQIFAAALFSLSIVGLFTVVRVAMRSLKSTFRVIGALLRTVGEKLAQEQANAPSEAPVNPRVANPSDAQIRAFLTRNKLVLVQAENSEAS